jgi:hypothetical protein
MHFLEIGLKGVYWIHLVEVWAQRQTLVKKVINLLLP